MKNPAVIIEELIEYGKIHLGLDELDSIFIRNRLLNLLGVDAPIAVSEDELSFIKDLKVPDVILADLREFFESKNVENVEAMCCQVMGALSPTPSFVREKVNALEKEKSGKGLDYLFDLSIKNDYIKKTAIDKNIGFKKDFDNKFVEVTINLSKPEKNNKDIAKLLTKSSNVKYPECALCLSNLGYQGRADHASRVNIRVVPLKLNGEDWFLQFSPYAYFDHHCIIINNAHHNMTINNDTFLKLLQFVDLYPTYFVGSNADLPIVGGSILNHEHYQGGTHLLPVFYAQDKEILYSKGGLKISYLDWYNSVIRIESKDIDKVVEASRKIFNAWINYDDPEIDIISHDKDGNRHSTVTPIARKIGKVYQMNIILRNNRCNEQYPDGIFHAHPEYHNIKHEGIGLIEAMGLFILPGRLKKELGLISQILTSDVNVEQFIAENECLKVHENMINELVSKHGRKLSNMKVETILNDYLADVCKNILINTAVFKESVKCYQSLFKFIEGAL